MTTASSGACESRHGTRYVRPFFPGASGLSTVLVRPGRPSSTTCQSSPSAACSRPGQRTSRPNRISPAGSVPQVFESPKQRTVRTARDNSRVTEIVIDRRFRGPDQSGNGGYTCGLVAGAMDGPAAVTLRLPPPLEVPLRVEDGRV